MEYVFGNLQEYETVRTKSRPADSRDLTGYEEIVRHYDDNIITDKFMVVKKTHTDTDSEGNVYNWYTIKNHIRYIDRYTPCIKYTEQEITELELELIELRQAIEELRGDN